MKKTKLHQIILYREKRKLWSWRYADHGGYCATKADALNDASISAGLHWVRFTDDTQTAKLGAGLTLCCTRVINSERRVDWELSIVAIRGTTLASTNIFDCETEAKCCAPAFVQKWKNEQNETH